MAAGSGSQRDSGSFPNRSRGAAFPSHPTPARSGPVVPPARPPARRRTNWPVVIFAVVLTTIACIGIANVMTGPGIKASLPKTALK